MTQQQTSPQPHLPIVRHDGWTGEKMAAFCETLAETAIVADACEAAGMGLSGAYAARRRNPLFAAAWDAALSIARERLADTLLARSMEGNIEQIWRDGALVGERHVIDNRLGLAILRRLDRLAEMGMAVSTIGQRVTPDARARPTPSCHPQPIDWSFAVDALRAGDDEMVAKGLALTNSPALPAPEGDKVDEVEGPTNPSSQGDTEHRTLDLSDRCWRDEREECWMTDFPPPPGFAGYQNRDYAEVGDDESYQRHCTDEEQGVLEALEAADREAERAEEEQLRYGWFAMLRAELEQQAESAPDQGAIEPAISRAHGLST